MQPRVPYIVGAVSAALLAACGGEAASDAVPELVAASPCAVTPEPGESWPEWRPEGRYADLVAAARQLYADSREDWRVLWIPRYVANGDYLNFSSSRPFDRLGPSMQWGEDGVPKVRSLDDGLFYYNAVTVAQFALYHHSRFAKGLDAALSPAFWAAVRRLQAMQDSRGAFIYEFSYAGLAPGWTSGMAQGHGLSVFARAYLLSQDPQYLEAGNAALSFLLRPESEGGSRGSLVGLDPSLGRLVFFEEWPAGAPKHSLNGFMFILLGLYDWAQTDPAATTGPALTAAEYFACGAHTLSSVLPYYEVEGFSAYDLGHMVEPGKRPYLRAHYHKIHVGLLGALYSVTEDPTLREFQESWAGHIAQPLPYGGLVPDALVANWTALNFGSLGMGATRTASVVLTNLSPSDVSVSEVRLPSADFGLSEDGCSGKTMKSFTACSVTVSFTPSVAGLQTGTLTVVSSASSNPMVPTTGNGVPNALIANRSAVNFGSLGLGASRTGVLVLTNYSSTPVSISGVRVPGGDFALTGDLCTGVTLQTGTACTVSVAFTPTAVGLQSGEVIVESNSTTNPKVPVSGNGVPSALIANREDLNFGSLGIGMSRAAVVVLSNYTPAPVAIQGLSAPSQDFPISQDGCTGSTLPPGTSCAFTVGFSPVNPGQQSGYLVVTSTVAGPVLAVTGNGVPSAVLSNRGTLNFGSLGLGLTRSAVLVLTNYTPDAVTVGGISLPPSDFTRSNDGCTGATMPSGASCTVTISFSPTSTGPQAGDLAVNSTATESPVVAVAGNGVPNALVSNRSTLNFGSLEVGLTRTAEVVLVNYTGGPVAVEGIASPSADLGVSSDGCSGTTLPPGAACAFLVSFSPSRIGLQSGNLVVSATSETSPSIPTVGNGI